MTARPLRRRRALPVAAVLALPLAMGAAVLPVVGSTAAGVQPLVAPAAKPIGVDASGFTRLPQFALDRSAKVTVAPRAYAGYSVSLPEVRQALAAAPTQAAVDRGAEALTFEVPAPDGTMTKFAVAEDSVMEPGLQAAHPEIRSYAGRSISGPARSIRLDTGPLGFHASVRMPGGGQSWYVDPAYVGDATEHLSYFGAAVPRSSGAFVERDISDTVRIRTAGRQAAPRVSTTPGGIVTRREYRLAFLTDPTYAKYFETRGGVLAAKVALVNRTDQVYNDDLAIKFILIDGTDKLNLATEAEASDANGPCGVSPCFSRDVYKTDGTSTGTPPVPDAPDGCDGALLDRNGFVLGQIVGADTFDIGHIGLGVNGGGIAGLGVVGGSSKASGCTGLPEPTGDFYAIDYFSHEVGHQMGGNHTFNGTQVNCSLTNRNGGLPPVIAPSTAVEPGSGSSVMAYAGICGNDNLQPHSDPYFSQRSIDEITDTTSADPFDVDEVQTVTLRGFDGTDSFQLGFPGATAPVTITRGAFSYNLGTVTASLFQLTGCVVSITEYDSGNPNDPTNPAVPGVNDGGFNVAFTNPDCSGTAKPRLTIGGFVGGATGFIGVVSDGGPETNIGSKQVKTSGHAPIVTAPADKDLPIRTPFTLTGSATDSDSDPLIYLWEQNDQGGAGPAAGIGLTDNTKINGPLFRVFGTYANVTKQGTLLTPSPGENIATSADRTRTFPDMAQVLLDNTNAETGTCPPLPAVTTPPTPIPVSTIDCYSEFLPTADYGAPVAGAPSVGGELNFRLTARDLAPEGGGTAFDDVTLTVDNTAGPFAVTSRATTPTPNPPATAGGSEPVTWAVNGTDAASLAPNVKITLSTDGGLTFPFVLADVTANDGSQVVTLPQVSTSRARIKIEAVNNYFFDVNDVDFKISGPLTVTTAGSATGQYSDALGGATVTASSSTVDGDQLVARVQGPDGIALGPATTSPDGVLPSTATFPVIGKITAPPGTYTATVAVGEGTGAGAAVKTATFDVVITPEDALTKYTGAKKFTSAGTATAKVALRANVGDIDDGSRGLIDRARVSFVNRANSKVLCTAPVTGGPVLGTATCTATLPATAGNGTDYTIGTVVGGNYRRDSAVDDTTVTVVRGAADVLAPDTSITSGPNNNSFVRGAQVVFGLKGTETPVTFRCLLDNRVVTCGKNVRTPVLATGVTHVLRVAARDATGNLDKTPAVRQFASPYTVAQLTQATQSWKAGKDPKSYRGTYLTTKFSGQTLTRRGSGITKISIVYTQLPQAGRVGVYLGTKLLRIVPTNGPVTKKRVLVLSKSFGSKMAGTVRLVTMDDKPVRIEGLGLLQPRV